MDEVTSLHTSRLPSFPVKEYHHVMDGLNKFTTWTVYPEQLGKCITCTATILRQNCR